MRKKYYNRCKHECKCVKPLRTHHCSTCGRCVLRMDHHCKWLANCVGQRNLKFFLNFVFYMGVFCLYSFVIFVIQVIEIFGENPELKSPKTILKLCIVIPTGLLTFLVSAFCFLQFCNQLHQIKKNRSYIDNLQNSEGNYSMELSLHNKIRNPALMRFQQQNYFDKLAEVFGDRNILWWFFPVYRLNNSMLRVEKELQQFQIS